MDLDGELREILRKKLPKETNIDGNAKLSDSGLDSLDVAEIAFDVEDKFRIQLPPFAAQIGEVTFMDLFRLVEEGLAAKTEEAGNNSAKSTS
jgi:acyl carrier protein